MMVADMSKKGPIARTILSYSESTNPNSPHQGDQTKLFARKQWVIDLLRARHHRRPAVDHDGAERALNRPAQNTAPGTRAGCGVVATAPHDRSHLAD
jgi:hypothetical protein